MPKYKITKTGYEIANNAYVDKRLVLTKDQMLTAEEDFILPEHYFAYCPDDGGFYTYDINYEVNSETGRYHKVNDAMAPFINTIIINGKDVSHNSETVSLSLVEDILYNGISKKSDGNVDLSFLVSDVLVNEDSVVSDGIAHISVPYTTSELINTGLIKDGSLQDLILSNQFDKFQIDTTSELEKINNIIGGDSSESLISKIDRLDSELDSETLIRKQEINRLDTLIYNTSERLDARIDSEVIIINNRINSESQRLETLIDSEVSRLDREKQDVLTAGNFIIISSEDIISADVGTGTLVIINSNSEELGEFNANSSEGVIITIPSKLSLFENDTNFASEGFVLQNKLTAEDPLIINNDVISVRKRGLVKDVRIEDSEGHGSTSLVNSEGIAILPANTVAVGDIRVGIYSAVDENRVAHLPAIAPGNNAFSTVLAFSSQNNSEVGQANGMYSVAIATGIANGFSSFAMNETIAENDYSTTFGQGTMSAEDAQFVFGKFNEPKVDLVEVVGGGDDSESLKNIRELDWVGNETLAGKLTSYDLEVVPGNSSNLVVFKNNISEGGEFVLTANSVDVDSSDSELGLIAIGGVKLFGLENPITIEGARAEQSINGFGFITADEDRTIHLRVNGPAIMYGQGAPDSEQGNDGDIYIELP